MQAILDPQACYVSDRKRRPRPYRKDNSHVLQLGNIDDDDSRPVGLLCKRQKTQAQEQILYSQKSKKQAIRPILTNIKKYYFHENQKNIIHLKLILFSFLFSGRILRIPTGLINNYKCWIKLIGWELISIPEDF